jgi:glycosyltransferase involved in cell wall biosynthesis
MLPYVHECQWLHDSSEKINKRYIRSLYQAASRSARLLTNSQFTADDIKQELQSNIPPIDIIYPAGDSALTIIKASQLTSLAEQIGLDVSKKFCLFVSSIRPKKNVKLIVDTFSNVPSLQDIQVVIAGRATDQEYFESIKTNAGHNVIFTGYLDDADIKALYKNATAFIYISQNEGFGLPILEAFEFNLPVIAVKNGSIQEVAGNGAIYLDKLNVQNLSKTVQKVLSDQKLRENMKKEQQIQLQKFNWKESAEKLSKIIDAVIKN